jgi:hypothetical protein
MLSDKGEAVREHKGVTRFEVIDHTKTGEGRILVRRGITVSLSFQDDGRTLKVFLTDAVQK